MLLTLDLLKKHVRAEDFTDDDECLQLYLEAATEWATLYTHRTASDLHSLAPDGESGGYPASFVQAVLLLAAAYYDQREATAGTTLAAVPYGVEALLKPYRRLYAPDQLNGEAYIIAHEAASAASTEYVVTLARTINPHSLHMSLENTEWLNDLKDGFADVFRALSPKEQSQALRRAYLKEGNRLLKRARDVVNASDLGKGRKVPRKPRVALNTARTPMGDGLYRRVYPKGGGFMVSAKPYRRNTKKGMHRNLYGQLKPILNFAADGTGNRSTGRAKRTKGKGRSTGRMPKLFDLRAVENGEARTVEGNIYTEFQRQCEAALRRKGLT